jgi:glycosyltransferase involved in cell wall biosynthesis
MKPVATFIFAFDGEEWSTPVSLLLAFKEKGWDIELVSIGSNSRGFYTDEQLRLWLKDNPKSDMVIFMDWGRFDSPLLDKSFIPSAFWVQESGDDPQNFDRNSTKSSRFHLTFTPDHDSYSEYKKMGRNVIWRTHWACPRTQYPIPTEPEYVAVTSRGYGSSSVLDILTDAGKGSFGNRNGMAAEEHTKFLNSGLMVVQHSRWGEITRRIFEGMVCGKLVLTDRLNESKKLHELFEEGKEIIFYENVDELVALMHYYNDHPEEREKIAEAGRKKVLEHHTSDIVADTLIKEWKEWKKTNIQ